MSPDPVQAASFDFSAPLQAVNVTQNAGVVSYNVFDPELGIPVGGTDNTGSVFSLSDAHGVVTWSDGSTVYSRIYNPALGQWVKTNVFTVNVGADLKTAHGVVTWSGNGFVYAFVYEPALARWIGGAATAGGTADLTTAHGIVTWSGGGATKTTYYMAYDPNQRLWILGQTVVGNSTFDLRTLHGIVAWSVGNSVQFRTYDPTRAAWIAGSDNTASTSDLRAEDGVVTWSHANVGQPSVYTVRYYAYDPLRGQWRGGATTTFQTFNLALINGSVFWTANNVNFTRGYNTSTGQWGETMTVPFAAFGVSTNAGNAPLPVWFYDLSLGGFNWSWNFGDGQSSGLRSPAHTYKTFARHTVTLTVSGSGGGNSVTNMTLLSDITPPTGSVLINQGESFTTNATVQLALAATDNSATVVGMRFSNDNTNWSDWEAFATTKSWTLSPGNESKTVFAQFRDPALNASVPATDTILLDTTPPPLASFEFPGYSVVESTNRVTVRVFLSAAFGRTVEVAYSTMGVTALPGEDYETSEGSLQFTPGQTVASFEVEILEDEEVELTEVLTLSLANLTNAMAGPPVSLTILDNDMPTIAFANTTYSVPEEAGPAQIGVRLSSPSGNTVTVRYAATNGTAQAGADYTAVVGQITFVPGQTLIAFPVAITNDDLDEGTESIALSLFNAVGAGLGIPAAATLTILDDDPPTASFAVATSAVLESDTAEIWVTLSKPFDEAVFVDFASSNGTARAGSDYFAANGTLIFGPGQTSKSFLVNIINDAESEPDETVALNITGAANAYVGATAQATLTILDNETLRLLDPRHGADGSFQSTVVGPFNRRILIEHSSTLTQWGNLLLMTNLSGMTSFQDTNTALPGRYYRALDLGPATP